MKIYFSSDLHFCHDREFLYKPRGFNSVWEMNEAIVANWNKIVETDDQVYVLGDLMLNNNDEGMRLLKSLKGDLHIMLGNHDTNTRIELYKSCYNVVDVKYADMLHYNGYHFYMSHYPTLTANLEKESLKKCTLDLFGHTHSKEKFYNDMPFMYNVACDAHDCTPVLIDDIINDCEDKVRECIAML